ncbi:MAG: MmcQ/YjbR family DNA-binding protein [Anaerolineae bacterium]|nr:MmcQ/YjbR family DNA-binding protein [Anaerolineae bacterium]
MRCCARGAAVNRNDLAAYCLSKPGAVVGQPFGPGADVFKVMGKMFALMPENADPPSISLKCDPTFAEILRQTYPAVTPAYHMNKRHWNGVRVDGSVPDDEIEEWIDHAYDLVVKGLTQVQRKQLAKLVSSE